jgi:hypothetical protein
MKGIVPLLMVFLIAAMPLDPMAAFYRYVDEKGVVHYVDDPGKIPERFLDQTDTYEESADGMPAQQSQELPGNPVSEPDESSEPSSDSDSPPDDREEISPGDPESDDNRLDTLINILRLQQEEKARLEKVRGTETPVKIRGNIVLVPVTLGYDRNEIQTTMILDTGANVISLHEEKAAPLNIRDFRTTKVRVAGGEILDAKMVQLSYVKVGPHLKKNIDTLLIAHEGESAPYDGLLGINFLKSFPHTIDFDKSVIRWQ